MPTLTSLRLFVVATFAVCIRNPKRMQREAEKLRMFELKQQN